MNPLLLEIGEQLRTQDNECTSDPMFCVQILKVTAAIDATYAINFCWWNGGLAECVYDDEPEGAEDTGSGWEKFGYETHWETVMVSFTRKGAEEYLELNGHNDRRRAHKGVVRIQVESFHRCPQMIAIREFLAGLNRDTDVPAGDEGRAA